MSSSSLARILNLRALVCRPQMKPFTAKRALVIEGGGLKQPWVLDCNVVDGIDYVNLQMTDRSLAKAMGMKMSDRSPLQGCDIFAHMIKMRDAKVDAIIGANRVADDPMADVSASSSVPVLSAGRPQVFATAKVPASIDVSFDAFVTPEGHRIEEHTLKIITTPKRGLPVTVEALPANFEWLRMACQVKWEEQPKKKKRVLRRTLSIDELPPLDWPLQYWKDPTSGATCIICYYRGEDGKYRTHRKKLEMPGEEDGNITERLIKHCAASVLAFFESNQCELGGAEEEDAAAAPLQDAE